ncbi:MAG: hypothetical protein WCQ50_12250 [Spirochaetota bacterium]
MKRVVVALAFIAALSVPVFAQEAAGIDTSLVVASTLEMKAEVSKTWSESTPFGGLAFTPALELSPITVAGRAALTWSAPIHLVTATLGGTVGSGWKFLSIANGVGVQQAGLATMKYSESPFSGIYFKGRAGGAIQFDTAAIWPGEWNHLITQSYHEIYYEYLTGTGASDVWLYEAGGSKINGFRYRSSSVLGYQMPLVLSRVLAMLETDIRVTNQKTSTMASGGWGSDFLYMVPGFLATFSFGKNTSLDTIVQFQNKLNYTSPLDASLYSSKVDAAQPVGWAFRRVAVILNVKL